MQTRTARRADAPKRRPGRRRRPVVVPVEPEPQARFTDDATEQVSPAVLKARWRAAFDAAEAALRSGGLYLSQKELHEHFERLAAEREPTSQLLRALARDQRASMPLQHLLLSPRSARRLLGLPLDAEACVFNLDGVLIGSAAVHAAAWTETFDDFLTRRSDRTRGRFAPFNPRSDYPEHIHGRPRLEGVRGFLASRGIRLPEGLPDDPPATETVHGIANQKNAAFLRMLDRQRLSAFAGAREYLETAHDAGLRCGVVSASANTATVLERTGLTGLIDGCVDGNVIVAEGLRPRPEPDIVLEACRRLDADPRHTAVFETSPAGIRAARAAACAVVIGVDHSGKAKSLRDAGADLVVDGLEEFLDRKLAA